MRRLDGTPAIIPDDEGYIWQHIETSQYHYRHDRAGVLVPLDLSTGLIDADPPAFLTPWELVLHGMVQIDGRDLCVWYSLRRDQHWLTPRGCAVDVHDRRRQERGGGYAINPRMIRR
jgi:hypothetical protein